METQRFALRIPEDLYKKLQEIAETESRSVNAQILVFLRESVEQWEVKNPKEDRQPSELVLAV